MTSIIISYASSSYLSQQHICFPFSFFIFYWAISSSQFNRADVKIFRPNSTLIDFLPFLASKALYRLLFLCLCVNIGLLLQTGHQMKYLFFWGAHIDLIVSLFFIFFSVAIVHFAAIRTFWVLINVQYLLVTLTYPYYCNCTKCILSLFRPVFHSWVSIGWVTVPL